MKLNFRNRRRLFDGITIKRKLVYAFILLVAMTAFAGGAGLFFISRIQNSVTTLSDTTSPISRVSNALATDMLNSNIIVLNILCVQNNKDIESMRSSLKQYKVSFHENLKKLSTLLKSGEIKLDLNTVKTARDQFETLSEKAIESHIQMQDQKTAQAESIEEFKSRTDQLNNALKDFIQSAQIAIGEAEDKGRTLSMNPEATTKQFSEVLLGMFAKDLPVLYRATTLQVMLVELQGHLSQYLSQTSLDQLAAQKEKFDSQAKIISGRLKRLKRKLKLEKHKQAHASLVEGFEALKFMASSENGLFAGHQQYLETAVAITGIKKELNIATDKIKTALQSVSKNSEQINKNVVQRTRKAVSIALWAIICVVSAGTGIGMFAALLIIRSIVHPLNQLKETVVHVEENSDYSIRVDETRMDEVGLTSQAFNSLMTALETVIKEINQVMSAVSEGCFTEQIEKDQHGDLLVLKNSINSSINLLSQTLKKVIDLSRRVSESAQSLSGSASILTENANSQAASIEQISQSMQHIGNRAKANEESALDVKNISAEAMEKAQNGNQQTEAMVAVMHEIESTSREVAKAVGMISDIAARTKLLSLNASIEAVRAGEAGKGFAVVAQEVGELAQSSSNAAVETENLIKTAMKEVGKGVENAEQTASVLNSIYSTVARVNDRVEEITSASVDQNTNIESINIGLNEMNKAVSQNSAIAAETEKAYFEMNQTATLMFESLHKFKLPESDSPGEAVDI